MIAGRGRLLLDPLLQEAAVTRADCGEDLVGGETLLEQRPVNTLQRALVRRADAGPAAGEDLLQKRDLVDLAEDLVYGGAGEVAVDAEGFDLTADAGSAAGLQGDGGTGVGGGDPAIVQGALARQPCDGVLDRGIVDAPTRQAHPDLRRGQLAAPEPGERLGVRVHESMVGDRAWAVNCMVQPAASSRRSA